MRLDGAVGGEVERERRLPDVVLFEGESVLDERRDGLALKVAADLVGVLPDGGFGRVEGHGVVEHLFEVGEEGVCVDVGFFVHAMLNVAHTDGSLNDLVVLGHLVAFGECIELCDDGIAACADDAAKVVDELAERGLETLAALAGPLAAVEEAALCEFGRVGVVPAVVAVCICIVVVRL